MIEETTTPLNPGGLAQNAAIVLGIAVAVAAFLLIVNHFGILRIGPRPELSTTGLSAIVETEDFRFTEQEIHLPAGAEISLDLFNADVVPHSFDVDELDIHIEMPANEVASRTFTLSQPGTYTFYCGVPGHREAGMVGTLIVEP
jgi:plastocyanin